MLSPSLWIIILFCLASDVVLLRKYAKVTSERSKFYGSIRYYGHVYAMKGFVYVGIFGLVCEVLGYKTILWYISKVIGLLAIIATPFTLGMALKAYGDRSVTTSGYMLYTLFYFRSGVMALMDTASSTAWVECWLLAHSYATCRIFTSFFWQLRQALKKLNFRPIMFSHKQAYNMALVVASVIVLYVTEGFVSVSYYLCMSLVVQAALFLSPWSLKDISFQHTFKDMYSRKVE